MSPLTSFRPFAAFLPCFLAVLIAAAPALGQSSRSPSRGSSPRNSSSKSSSKNPSKAPSKVSAKSPQKINDADANKPSRWARFKSFFGFGDKRSKKSPSANGRSRNMGAGEDLDYGPTYDRVPAEVADALPVYDRVPAAGGDQVPADNGNQAGGGGQYQPGPVQPNSPYAPGPIVSQYGNLALKPQPVYDRAELISSPGGNNAAGQQKNQYGNIGLRARPGNVYEAADGPIASSVAVAAGNIAAGRPADSASGNYAPAPSRNGNYAPAPNRNGIYQPAPDRNYAAAPANPQARNNWQPNPAPIGRQNALSPRQQAGPTTMDVAQILLQGGVVGNVGGGNGAGQPRSGIGQGGQNLGAMAGFNRGGGQPYVVPLQRALPPGQNNFPNIKRN